MSNDIKKEIYSWGKSTLFALVVAVVCRQFLFVPVTVNGESMVPAFEGKNKILVAKISKLEHFDLVVFHSPVSDEDHIKRVIGLPGDSVEVKNDVLYINKKEYKEPYLKANKEEALYNQNLTEDLKVKVPKGALFVMGDNRLRSGDSRIYGFVPKKSVVGEVKFRYYPIQHIGFPE